MNKLVRIGSAMALTVIGIWLLTLRSDREFIALPPTAGRAYVIPLVSERIYSQSFTATADTISRVAVYVHPLEGVPATSAVSLRVSVGEQQVERKLGIVFADGETSLAADVTPPLSAIKGERVTITLAVPTELSGKVGVATRQQDDSFNRDAVFTIDGEAQANPMAYHVHTKERAHVAIYSGGLLLLAAAALLAPLLGISLQHPVRQILYSITVVLIANAPFLSEREALIIIPIQAVILFGSLQLLRRLSLPIYAQLLIAHTIAFTTWWPLVLFTDHSVVSMTLTSLKDVFLNPNQIDVPLTGAYVGLPVLVLAVVGLVRWRIWTVVAFAVGMLVSPIIATVALAISAGMGLTAMMSFIQRNKVLTSLLAYTITYLMLLELWSVYARLMQVL